ncbi:hypothetical protein B0T18DRAFT_390282 [Schizothecium vesticola]|uniref:Uncharacterized protein n=1 Tax=Schizothecium vesticola TaxID=314040 RepID=A0AA40EUC8_9PEZI|nr:hypothetical protein B0T18DRAFT_390282 [Schizothecium vesticola]
MASRALVGDSWPRALSCQVVSRPNQRDADIQLHTTEKDGKVRELKKKKYDLERNLAEHDANTVTFEAQLDNQVWLMKGRRHFPETQGAGDWEGLVAFISRVILMLSETCPSKLGDVGSERELPVENHVRYLLHEQETIADRSNPSLRMQNVDQSKMVIGIPIGGEL